jgi:hypothetical protein
MKKGLILILALLGFVLMAGCDSETTEVIYGPDDLKPPLGLVAYSGDQAVTLDFVSSNVEDIFWGFAAHMAEGDFSATKVPGSYYDDPDVENFDAYGDGTVCGGDSCEGDTNGLQPVAYVEDGAEGVLAEFGVELPGAISWLISDGDLTPVMGDVDEGDDDDDVVADDDDDDEGALVYPSAATTGDDDDDDDDDDDTEAPDTTGGEALSLVNGQIYTAFVVARGDEGSAASWTSNYVTFIPRPESDSITLTPGASWTCGASTTNGLDIGEGGVESFVVDAFDSCSGLYVGTTDAEVAADLVLEASGDGSDQYGLVGAYPYFSATNGGLMQDLGYYPDWAMAQSAPIDETSYVTPGMSVLAVAGHVYAIRTGDGYFAKVWVSSIDETDNSVTLVAAYQTLTGNPSLKK